MIELYKRIIRLSSKKQVLLELQLNKELTNILKKENTLVTKRLVAYVIPLSGQALTSSELRRFLQERLPEYMVPSGFMYLDSLPLLLSGKVDRKALPVAEVTTLNLDRNFVAPCTVTEKVVAAIWALILKLEQVGIYDDFLELGGHSLLATQIVSRIKDIYQVELPLYELFKALTVANLAQYIETACKERDVVIPPIQAVSREQRNLPLSFPQAQLWFLDELNPNLLVYNELATIGFKHPLNVPALHKSLKEIVRRHEILRTTYSKINGQPVQTIAGTLDITLPVVDLRSLPKSEREDEALRQATLEAKQPLDLTKSPLLRAILVQLEDNDYKLFLTMHHIICDGVSLYNIFFRELKILYSAFSEGKPSPLPDLPIQYADFAIWQRQWLRGEVLESQMNYWKQQLADLPTLQIPTARPRPVTQTFRGAMECLKLPLKLTNKLKALSRQERVTLFMTLLAAFNTLLYRYTAQEDIVVGTVVAGRTQPELQNLMGYFLNNLVLRTDISNNPSFQELLGRVRKTNLDAYTHQDLPFQYLVQALNPRRNLNHNPLFQVAFILEPPISNTDSGWTLSQLDIDLGISKVDLTLELDDRPEGVIGRFEYNTDLFDANTIIQMAEHFQILLEAITTNPQQKVSELSLLTQKEQQQLLVDWNNTQITYPHTQCIHQLFESQVEKTPDAVAINFENQQLTYQELNKRANQLAHYLKTLGVKPEVFVGISAQRSLEMVIGLLAILKAGGAYVPLDPQYPQKRLAYILEDSQVSVLLTQEQFVAQLPQNQAQVICLDLEWEKISEKEHTNLVSNVQLENAIYLIYTSGSTGKPKGVINTHQGICNRLLWMQEEYQLTAIDRVLQKTSFCFDVSVWEFFWTLSTGACLVVAKPEGHRDQDYLVNLIVQQQITTVHFVPSMLQIFLDNQNLEYCRCLRQVICSGEALSFKLQEKFFQRLGFEIALHNLYGPTEAAIDVTYCKCEIDKHPNIVPIGQPIANTQLYILDKYLQIVPIGVPGELYIGGIGLARGYFNQPELTAEKFIPNPFSNQAGERLYKTGDLARYLADGNIEFLGRIDHQVKIRGFRIEIGEIEAILSQHPCVREVVVIVHEDLLNERRLVAYLSLYPQKRATASELRQFLQEKLPEYMIPAIFMILSALPLTFNGKIDRRSLPTPNITGRNVDTRFIAPRTPIETTLTQIWVDVLRLEEVGVYDNFFELGGHSLLATQLISRLRDTLSVELPLSSLFKHPTIAELCQYIHPEYQEDQNQILSPIQPSLINKDIPLSFAQQRLWFLEQLMGSSSIYNIPIALSLKGQISIIDLKLSLEEIVQRHEILRTNFLIKDESVVQVISPNLTISLPIIDLQQLSPTEQFIRIERLFIEECQQVFNLADGCLWQVTLLQLKSEEYVLFLTMHHINFGLWTKRSCSRFILANIKTRHQKLPQLFYKLSETELNA